MVSPGGSCECNARCTWQLMLGTPRQLPQINAAKCHWFGPAFSQIPLTIMLQSNAEYEWCVAQSSAMINRHLPPPPLIELSKTTKIVKPATEPSPGQRRPDTPVVGEFIIDAVSNKKRTIAKLVTLGICPICGIHFPQFLDKHLMLHRRSQQLIIRSRVRALGRCRRTRKKP